ncbi:MAG: ThuA domain-containing protein [Defluviitaleaceae bacterium]|nr:ThuA domain-containing protein [Defluviitaleaceae bacterium]
MRVLLFCGDHYHPAEAPINGMKLLETKGFKIDVISDATGFDASVLKNYNAIVMSKCDHISQANDASWKTTEIQEAFVKYVENGGGFLAVHSGIVSGEENDTSLLDKMIGCKFTWHPNNCTVTSTMLKPHPITEGVGTFSVIDEHYHLEILADDIEILATSYAEAQGDPEKYDSEPYHNAPAHIEFCAYTRTQKKGRICVLTQGHDHGVWQNPEFQKLLENALRWCVIA